MVTQDGRRTDRQTTDRWGDRNTFTPTIVGGEANNSTSNPHMYRVVGLLRLHREIGTQMEIRLKILQKNS